MSSSWRAWHSALLLATGRPSRMRWQRQSWPGQMHSKNRQGLPNCPQPIPLIARFGINGVKFEDRRHGLSVLPSSCHIPAHCEVRVLEYQGDVARRREGGQMPPAPKPAASVFSLDCIQDEWRRPIGDEAGRRFQTSATSASLASIALLSLANSTLGSWNQSVDQIR